MASSASAAEGTTNNNPSTGRTTRLEQLCQGLCRHDPTVVEVIIGNYDFPIGCASVLGDVLNKSSNTHVHSLTLGRNATSLEAYSRWESEWSETDLDDYEEIMEPMLSYIRTSQSLRTFQSDDVLFPGIWLNAVAQNSGIEKVIIFSDDGPNSEVVANLPAETTSLKCLDLNLGEGETYEGNDLLEVIQSNRTLESLTFRGSFLAERENSTALLNCLVGHPTIRYLDLDMDETEEDDMETREFDGFMLSLLSHSSSALTHFSLGECRFDKFRAQQLVKGLAANPNVTKLTLAGCSFTAGAMAVFASHVKATNHLRTLEWLSGSHKRDLFIALRSNASLHNVIARRYETSIWNAKEERLVQAWCQRNRHLGDWLTAQTGGDDQGVKEQGNAAAALVPAMFSVALHTPQRTAFYLVTGISAQSQSMGPD